MIVNVMLHGFAPASAARHPWCPFPDWIEDSKCYCQLKFGIYRYMYCDNLGNVTQIPTLTATEATFREFHIRGKTSLGKIQNNAFCGVKVGILRLQGLGIQQIEANAFSCLGSDLKEIHLDDNRLTELPIGVFNSLTSISYLGLQNNDISQLHPHTFSNMRDLRYCSIILNIQILNVLTMYYNRKLKNKIAFIPSGNEK